MIENTIHVRDLKLAEGIEILDPGNVSIVTVAAKRGTVGEEAAPAAAEEEEGGAKEPEIVGKKGAKEEE